MRRMFTLLLLLASPTVVSAQDGGAASACEQARLLVEELRSTDHLPGVQLAVLEEGRPVCSVALGLADLEQQVPVSETTRFRIGSISKALTSAALGLLVEEGKLDLDAPVQRYVLSFPAKRQPITTRQLAGHLSGLPHYDTADFINTKHYPDVIAALDKFADRELLFEPGERFSYSSFGWNLIAAVLQEASGVEFLELMQTRVFGPLGLSRTVADQYRKLIPDRTAFYQVSGSGRTINAPAIDNSDVWAAGGFLSTAEELSRFVDGLAAGRLLRPETVAMLFEPLHTNDGEATTYGLGWANGELEGVHWVGHGGSHVGCTAQLLFFAESRLAVALLTNANSRGLTEASMEIAQVYLRPD